MMTALKKTSDEVGAMDFPAVVDLLNYWLEFPPEHLLLRAMAGYEGKKDRGNWRSRRAQEMGDETYVPIEEKAEPEKPSNIVNMPGIREGGARHLDCAPPHIQQAIERVKKNKHLDISKTMRE